MTHRTLLATVASLGLLARVGMALGQGNAFQFPDEAAYADTAHHLIAGQGFGAAYTRVPAYPVILAMLAGPTSSSVLLLRITQAVVTGFGVLLVYGFTVRVFGRGPALAAALLYALDPVLVAAGGLLYPEAISALVMVAVVFTTILAVRQDRVDRAALAGLLLGVLVQLRPVALVLIPVLAVWLYLSQHAPHSRRLLHTAALLGVCLLSLLPWTYRNYRVHGQLMPVATAGTRSAPVRKADVERLGLTASILDKAWTQPARFARRVGREFVHFWEIYPTRLASDDPRLRTDMRAREPRLSEAPMFSKWLRDTLSAVTFSCELGLGALGLGLAWRTHRREAALICLMILAFALGYAMFVAKLRYRIPILPLLFAFSGSGAAVLWEALGTRARGRMARSVSAWQE